MPVKTTAFLVCCMTDVCYMATLQQPHTSMSRHSQGHRRGAPSWCNSTMHQLQCNPLAAGDTETTQGSPVMPMLQGMWWTSTSTGRCLRGTPDQDEGTRAADRCRPTAARMPDAPCCFLLIATEQQQQAILFSTQKARPAICRLIATILMVDQRSRASSIPKEPLDCVSLM